MPEHVPVMSAEVVAALAPGRGGLFVDGTVGLGGHAAALLEAGAVAADRDRSRHATRSRSRASGWRRGATASSWCTRTTAQLPAGARRARAIGRVDGILADLGVSSLQLDAAGRGFSFQRDEPLDMRMDRSAGPTAADLVAALPEQELADVIFRFGEERYSRRIARAIVEARRAAADRDDGPARGDRAAGGAATGATARSTRRRARSRRCASG